MWYLFKTEGRIVFKRISFTTIRITTSLDTTLTYAPENNVFSNYSVAISSGWFKIAALFKYNSGECNSESLVIKVSFRRLICTVEQLVLEAFGCLVPGVLIVELHVYGFVMKSLSLKHDYLASRKQRVTVDG